MLNLNEKLATRIHKLAIELQLEPEQLTLQLLDLAEVILSESKAMFGITNLRKALSLRNNQRALLLRATDTQIAILQELTHTINEQLNQNQAYLYEIRSRNKSIPNVGNKPQTKELRELYGTMTSDGQRIKPKPITISPSNPTNEPKT